MTEPITITHWLPFKEAQLLPQIPWGWVREFPDPCDWPTYLDCIAPDTAPYVSALRAAIIAQNIRFGGDWHQNAPNGAAIFSDGKSFCTSMRAWGRLLAAIWTSEDGSSYRYVDFYMDGGWENTP